MAESIPAAGESEQSINGGGGFVAVKNKGRDRAPMQYQ
jgi:hypothetical protein